MAVAGIGLILAAYAGCVSAAALGLGIACQRALRVLSFATEHPGRIAKRSLFLPIASSKPKRLDSRSAAWLWTWLAIFRRVADRSGLDAAALEKTSASCANPLLRGAQEPTRAADVFAR
jgi:hypothetical protein